MANNYCDMTGVLKLKKVTPVIRALFQAYALDASYPGNGESYIAEISEDSNNNWDTVLEDLTVLASTLGLSMDDQQTDAPWDVLQPLAKHFGKQNASCLAKFNSTNLHPSDIAELDDLFEIAHVLDDGHGLSQIVTETAWYCSKPRLFEFGGGGCVFGDYVRFARNSSESASLGARLDQALSEKNIKRAAQLIQSDVALVLKAIIDPVVRGKVQLELAQLFEADA
jgi:hypothetical protein